MANRETDDLLNDAEQADVEKLLHAFAPRASRLNPLQLMYQAGQASVRGGDRASVRRWLWPAAAVAMTIAASVLATLLVSRPPVREVEKIVVIERPARDHARAPQPDGQGVQPVDDQTPDFANDERFASDANANTASGAMSDGGIRRPDLQVSTTSLNSPLRVWETAKTVGQMRRDLIEADEKSRPSPAGFFIDFFSHPISGDDL